ncbi:MAG: type II toxin-antitoxin system HicB family antitoxin [Cyanobacteria bacterium J06648_11]
MDAMWLGYLKDDPDYWLQGLTEAGLRENLLDIHKNLIGELIPHVRRVAKLEVS